MQSQLGQNSLLSRVKKMLDSGVIREKTQQAEVIKGASVFISEFSYSKSQPSL